MNAQATAAHAAMQQEITRFAANPSPVALAVLQGRQSGHMGAVVTADAEVFYEGMYNTALCTSFFTDIDAVSLPKDTIRIGFGFEIPRGPAIDKPYKLGTEGLYFELIVVTRDGAFDRIQHAVAATGEIAFREFHRDANRQQLTIAVEARHVVLKNPEVNLTLVTGTFIASGRIPPGWDP